jgi:hypothetical protein
MLQTLLLGTRIRIEMHFDGDDLIVIANVISPLCWKEEQQNICTVNDR